MRLPLFIRIIYQSIVNTIQHDGVEHAGYLSFLLMLGIFPSLVFFTAIVGPISNLINIPLIHTLTDIILNSPWASFIDALKPRIIEISTTPSQKFVIIAILSAVWTASSIFEAIRTTLNRAYNISKPPAYIWRRLLSIVEFMILVAVIAIIVVILIVAPIALQFIGQYATLPENLLFIANDSILHTIMLYAAGIIFLLYVYCFLPSIRRNVKESLPGAAFVLVLWSISSSIFQYYIAYFPQINLIYGSIAGIIISLLYFYMCSFILICGAELNSHLLEYKSQCRSKNY